MIYVYLGPVAIVLKMGEDTFLISLWTNCSLAAAAVIDRLPLNPVQSTSLKLLCSSFKSDIRQLLLASEPLLTLPRKHFISATHSKRALSADHILEWKIKTWVRVHEKSIDSIPPPEEPKVNVHVKSEIPVQK